METTIQGLGLRLGRGYIGIMDKKMELLVHEPWVYSPPEVKYPPPPLRSPGLSCAGQRC